ncbi:MAG TPA: polysaccharide deacetylase family protein [Chitinivibrionales bacterium]|nr:polysaccharide deacetylase family protein [Chitinivibrionales bacterium]
MTSRLCLIIRRRKRVIAPIMAAALSLCILTCSNSFVPMETATSTPIVAVTFDDADSSIYTTGFRLMRATDTTWTATHFFPVSFIGQSRNITLDEEKEMERGGWETGGHGATHDNLSSLPPDTMNALVKASYDFLVQNGLSHQSYAYASGMYNDTVKAVVAKYFENIRTSHDYYYLDGVNRQELGYFAVEGGFTSDDIIVRVEDAMMLGAPLVVIGFHIILPDSAPPVPTYYVKESAFRGFLSYLAQQHLRVMGIRDAMKILCGS